MTDKIKYKESKRKLPFACCIVDKGPVKIANRHTGETVILEPDAVAVYDTIIGSEYLGLWKDVRKGLDWFRKHEPKAYYVLLD